MAVTQWELRRGVRDDQGIRVIVCDDDAAFLDLFQQELLRCFEKLNIHASVSLYSRMADISEGQLSACDIAFMDIDFEEEDRNGIDLAKALRTVNSSALIFFVTNFIDYAPAGYEVQAFRYILKRDVHDVLEHYLLQAMEQYTEGQVILRLYGTDTVTDLPLSQIPYLEVMDHSVSVHAGAQAYVVGAPLSRFEQCLEPHGFLRIHKSYLVNMAHIRKFRSRCCVLTDGTELMVSEKNYAQQKQKYLLWKGLK